MCRLPSQFVERVNMACYNFLSCRDIFDPTGACVQVIGARNSVVAVLVVGGVVEALY